LITGLDRLLGLQEVEASRISRQLAHEGGKVSFTHRPLLPPGDVCVCMYVCTYACMYVCTYACMCVYVCIYVCSPCSIELNTCELFTPVSFIEDDDYESLLSLVVVTLVINLLNILFKLLVIMSMRIYITIINFVAVCFWLATFRK